MNPLLAKQLAEERFAGMVHRDGKPAVHHSNRVALALREDHTLMTIAYLHDVVEDTDTTEEEIRSSFGDRVADAVMALTRGEGESWKKYYDRVLQNRDAVLVKIADVRDNVARMDAKMAAGSRGGAMYHEALHRLLVAANAS